MSGEARERGSAARWLPWVLLALVAAITLVVAATGALGPTTNEERVHAVAQTIKCPTCRGESVAESNAELSRTMRIEIAQRVEAGETDEQIRRAFADRYTDAILLTPSGSGLTGLVWVLPVAALIAALVALGFAFRRWSAHTPEPVTEQDRALVAEALAARDDTHGEGAGDR